MQTEPRLHGESVSRKVRHQANVSLHALLRNASGNAHTDAQTPTRMQKQGNTPTASHASLLWVLLPIFVERAYTVQLFFKHWKQTSIIRLRIELSAQKPSNLTEKNVILLCTLPDENLRKSCSLGYLYIYLLASKMIAGTDASSNTASTCSGSTSDIVKQL